MDENEYLERLFKDVVEREGCFGSTMRFAVILLLVMMMFCGCATKTKIEYRDRDVNHYITSYVHDTLRENTHDSIYVEKEVRDDTVWLTKYVEKTRYRDRVVEKSDTCWRDSVVTEYKESVKEVTKIPNICWFSIVFSVIVIIFAIYKLVRWLRTII